MKIEIAQMPFAKQKGVYTIIERQPFIIIKEDLHPVTRSIVIAHELGHHMLHKAELKKTPTLQEFNIFDMTDNHIEYEANVFVAELLVDESSLIELIHQKKSIDEIAKALFVDPTLISLKVRLLIDKGYDYIPQDYDSKFLK